MSGKMKVVKTSLKSICDKHIQQHISDISIRCNKIVIRVYQFIKLYMLKLFDDQDNDMKIMKIKIPDVDQKFVLDVISVVTFNSNKGGPKQKKTKTLSKMKQIYDKYFVDLIIDDYDYANLSHIMRYLATDIVTNIINNVKFNFIKHLRNFVKFRFDISDKKTLGKIINEIQGIDKREFKVYKKGFSIRKTNFKSLGKVSNSYVDGCVKYIKTFFLPKQKEENLIFDIYDNPTKYIPYMMSMCREIEKYNSSLPIGSEDRLVRLYKVFPLRSSIIPKYIPIDTTIIKDLLVKSGVAEMYKKDSSFNTQILWHTYFPGLFKKKRLTEQQNYVFGNLIYTDGVAVSIYQKKSGYKNGKYTKKEDFEGAISGSIANNTTSKKLNKYSKNGDMSYIDEIPKRELDKIKETYKLLGVDPGKRGIVTMIDKEGYKLRYTALQRRRECGFKKNRRKIMEVKDPVIIEEESKLSQYNQKSCMVNDFIKYIKAKNKINHNLFDFYEIELFRKLKWKAYMNTQQSEAKFVNSIKRTYAPNGEKICLMYGNWSQTKQMRNYFPTPGIGFKKMLGRYFKVLTVDEFRTSIICRHCEHELEKFMYRDNPKPYKKGTHLVHSLLRCKNVNCNKFWDRDVNGSSNILKLALYYMNNNSRPEVFQRGSVNV
jgi:hypothetical protein